MTVGRQITLQAQHRYRGKSLHIEEVHAGEYSQTEEPIFSSEYTRLQKEVSGSCYRPNTLWSSLDINFWILTSDSSARQLC